MLRLYPGCSRSGPLRVDSLGLLDAPLDHVVEHVVQERVALRGLLRLFVSVQFLYPIENNVSAGVIKDISRMIRHLSSTNLEDVL